MIDTKVSWSLEHIDSDEKMHIEGSVVTVALELEKILYRVYEYVWLTDPTKLASFKRDVLHQIDAQYDLFMTQVQRCEECGTTDKMIELLKRQINHEGWLNYGKDKM